MWEWQGVYLEDKVWERDEDTDGISVGDIAAVTDTVQGMWA
jgi:hypothetical protein